MTKSRQDNLTPEALSTELGISLDQSRTLMSREDFPSTEVAPGHFVVQRGALEIWISKNARKTDVKGS